MQDRECKGKGVNRDDKWKEEGDFGMQTCPWISNLCWILFEFSVVSHKCIGPEKRAFLLASRETNYRQYIIDWGCIKVIASNKKKKKAWCKNKIKHAQSLRYGGVEISHEYYESSRLYDIYDKWYDLYVDYITTLSTLYLLLTKVGWFPPSYLVNSSST